MQRGDEEEETEVSPSEVCDAEPEEAKASFNRNSKHSTSRTIATGKAPPSGTHFRVYCRRCPME